MSGFSELLAKAMENTSIQPAGYGLHDPWEGDQSPPPETATSSSPAGSPSDPWVSPPSQSAPTAIPLPATKSQPAGYGLPNLYGPDYLQNTIKQSLGNLKGK